MKIRNAHHHTCTCMWKCRDWWQACCAHVQALNNERVPGCPFSTLGCELFLGGQRGADGEHELQPGCPPPASRGDYYLWPFKKGEI